MQSMIFERFVQVDSTTTKSREGSGIGLSIVKSLVEMHGGSITLKSNEGHGSEFIMEIPERLIEDEKEVKDNDLDDNREMRNVEKINIEFSDIYN